MKKYVAVIEGILQAFVALGAAEVSLSVLMLAKPGTDADRHGTVP